MALEQSGNSWWLVISTCRVQPWVPLSRIVLGMTENFWRSQIWTRQNWQNQPSVDFKCCFIFTLPWGNDPIWPQFVQVENTPAPGAQVLFLWWASHGSVQVVRIISELFDKFDVPLCHKWWVCWALGGGFFGARKNKKWAVRRRIPTQIRRHHAMIGEILLAQGVRKLWWYPFLFFLISWDARFLGFPRLIPSFFADHPFFFWDVAAFGCKPKIWQVEHHHHGRWHGQWKKHTLLSWVIFWGIVLPNYIGITTNK